MAADARDRTEREIHFMAIPGERPGHTTLTLWPPKTHFGDPEWTVLVGGCGVGKAKTRAAAEALLLTAAQACCDRRVAAAEATAAHYRRVRPSRLERTDG